MKKFFEKVLPDNSAAEKSKGVEAPKNPEIDRLERPTEIILEKILGSIEKGEYDLIIGADASGRIPTLIFSKVIGYLYQKLGYQPPKTIFLAGAGMGLTIPGSDKGFLKNKQGGQKSISKDLLQRGF